jgi:hypothetical protein
VLSQVHPELNISRKAMDVMQSFMTDAFEQIADEAARLTRYSERLRAQGCPACLAGWLADWLACLLVVLWCACDCRAVGFEAGCDWAFQLSQASASPAYTRPCDAPQPSRRTLPLPPLPPAVQASAQP